MAAAIPWIIAATTVAGAVVGVRSAREQSRASQQQYQAAAAANAYNEQVLKERAAQVVAAANQREEQLRVTQRLERGKRLAFIAQSGTGFEGTNLDVERQNDVLSEIDALNIRYQGQLEANGLLSQAGLEAMYRGTNMESVRTARRLGYISMAGNALSGISRSSDAIGRAKYGYGNGYGSGIPVYEGGP